jgi:PLP dependent protein
MKSEPTILARVAAVQERIARAAERAGRSPSDVTLVAVSKNHPAEAVHAAFDAGLRVFGENRVQEAEGKVAALAHLCSHGLRWHLVGHLQGNKARKAAALFDCVHSVDGADIALRLARVCVEQGRTLEVLVQVDPALQPTKFGLPEEQLMEVLEGLREQPALSVVGLMGFPPWEEDPGRARPYFRRVRELAEEAFAGGLLRRRELSMGMSHDLEVAIEEGSTMVRVGTAIFGERA